MLCSSVAHGGEPGFYVRPTEKQILHRRQPGSKTGWWQAGLTAGEKCLFTVQQWSGRFGEAGAGSVITPTMAADHNLALFSNSE